MRQTVVYKHGYDASCANGAQVNKYLKRKRREAAYECGQRIYIKYSNGVETTYSYKKETRLLDAIKTTSKKGSLYQNIKYDFTEAGNIKRYTNDCLSDTNGGNYKTWQKYEYDSLYQLTYVHGETEFNRYGLSSPEHFSEYEQTFSFDRLGNMKTKKSSEVTVTGSKKGDDLNYEFDYEVEEGCAHRYSRIGTRYYKYDEVGNLLAEQTGAFGTEDDDNLYKIEELKEKTYGMNEGWGVFNKEESAEGSKTHHRKTDRRTYEWNAENQLVETSDEAITVGYTYGADGKRASKYTHNSETLYFNDYWVWHIDNATKDRGGKVTKNIYLGTERLASRIGSYKPYDGEENENTFFYHSDHLGSAQLVTDCNGDEYQRIEYTPYGETWIDLKTQISLIAKLPYKFSAKELDEETGLYYYGARYLDPKYSRWISADPAMNTGEYFPVAPIDDEAKKHNQNLPGMGGVFNHINSNLYHYAANNPIKYTDPDGRDIYLSYDIKKQTDFYLKYEKAVNYLLGSKINLVRTIFNDLRQNDITLIIKCGEKNKFNSNVSWVTNTRPYNYDTKVYNSSAIGLFHEMIHAWVSLTKNGKALLNEFIKKNKAKLDTRYNKYKEEDPDFNMSKERYYEEEFATYLEQKVAGDLGEDHARVRYLDLSDDICNVDDVTEWGRYNGPQE